MTEETEAPEDELPEPSNDIVEGEPVLSSFWQREPALVIGSLVAIGVQVVGVIAGNGLISDAVAGHLTDIFQTLGALVVALLPVITAALIRTKVSPAV